MKNTQPGTKQKTDPELDAELAQMAEKVPPMPADFHEKWMNAVRMESQKSVNSKGKASPDKSASTFRWSGILSIAAVFVFLIGGTVLYRNSRHSLTSNSFRAEEKHALLTTAEISGGGELLEAGIEEKTKGTADMEGTMTDTAIETVSGTDEVLPQDFMKAAESSGATLDVPPAANAEAPMMASEAMEDVIVEGYRDEAAAETAEAHVPLATGAPELTASEPEPEKESAESERKTGFLQQAGSFIADMGDFLMAALPYLLVLAVPAATAVAVRRRKRK